jgi:AraC-like DNA-binding protein
MSARERTNTSPVQFISSFRQQLPAQQFCPAHAHEELELVFHLKGSGVITTADNKSYSFRQNSLTICQPGVIHSQQNIDSGEDICLLVHLPEENDLYPEKISRLENLSDSYILNELYSLSREVPTERRRTLLNLRASALVIAIAHEIQDASYKRESSTATWYATEAMRLADSVAEFKTVAEIATALDISPDYLRHLFNDHFGRSLKSHIDSKRIKRAKELLAIPGIPQKSIHAQCGFSTESYFCTAFKKATQLTPNEFRTSLLKK